MMNIEAQIRKAHDEFIAKTNKTPKYLILSEWAYIRLKTFTGYTNEEDTILAFIGLKVVRKGYIDARTASETTIEFGI